MICTKREDVAIAFESALNHDFSKSKLKITIEEHIKKGRRSLEQNALMWSWYAIIKQYLEETRGEIYREDDLHEYFVGLLLPMQPKQVLDKWVFLREKTSKMTVNRHAYYLSRLYDYCNEHLGLQLPTTEDWFDWREKALAYGN